MIFTLQATMLAFFTFFALLLPIFSGSVTPAPQTRCIFSPTPMLRSELESLDAVSKVLTSRVDCAFDNHEYCYAFVPNSNQSKTEFGCSHEESLPLRCRPDLTCRRSITFNQMEGFFCCCAQEDCNEYSIIRPYLPSGNHTVLPESYKESNVTWWHLPVIILTVFVLIGLYSVILTAFMVVNHLSQLSNAMVENDKRLLDRLCKAKMLKAEQNKLTMQRNLEKAVSDLYTFLDSRQLLKNGHRPGRSDAQLHPPVIEFNITHQPYPPTPQASTSSVLKAKLVSTLFTPKGKKS